MKDCENYTGTFPADRIPKLFYTKKSTSEKFCIANTNTIGGDAMGHWVAICKKGAQTFVYDSFGRSSNELSPYYDKDWKISDPDREQEYEQINCGARCCSFIACAKAVGLEDALKNI